MSQTRIIRTPSRVLAVELDVGEHRLVVGRAPNGQPGVMLLRGAVILETAYLSDHELATFADGVGALAEDE